MSIKISNVVWGYQGNVSAKLALLAMADYADDRGICWPGMGAIAKKICLSKSQAQRVVHNLIDEGVLSVTGNHEGGYFKKMTRRYQINLDRLTGSADAAEGSHPCGERGSTHATQTIIEPSLTVKGGMASPKLPPLVQPKNKTRPSTEVTFNAWYDQIKANGEKAITEYRPVWDYAQKVGLPSEWVNLAWFTFKERYSTDANHIDKKYKDWRQTFLSAVKSNWFKLWFVKDDQFSLSTQGHQAELATREAA